MARAIPRPRRRLVRSDVLLRELEEIRDGFEQLQMARDQRIVLLRRMGVSYQRIGAAAGLSGQAVWKRFGDVPIADTSPAG